MLAPGTILQGRYKLIEQLGKGGMGTVYKAEDTKFDFPVALKATYFQHEKLHEQFEVEARLLYRLRHPALPRVIDKFEDGGGKFLVMDFITGEDLSEMMKNSSDGFPLPDVLTWADKLLDALCYLHSQNPPIIHRDIKLQNLKLSANGQITLLDFGLAKGLWERIVDSTKTVIGSSFNYSPLEQTLQVDSHWYEYLLGLNPALVKTILERGTDERTDIFALAVTLLRLVTGKTPPAAPVRAASVWQGSIDPLMSVFVEKVPRGVAETLTRAMALDPHDRTASAAEMRKALAAYSPAAMTPFAPMPLIQTPVEHEAAPALILQTEDSGSSCEPVIPSTETTPYSELLHPQPPIKPQPPIELVEPPRVRRNKFKLSGVIAALAIAGLVLAAVGIRNYNRRESDPPGDTSSFSNQNDARLERPASPEPSLQPSPSSVTPEIATPSPSPSPSPRPVSVKLHILYDYWKETIVVTLKPETGRSQKMDADEQGTDHENPMIFRNVMCGQPISLSATYKYQGRSTKQIGEFRAIYLDCGKSAVDLGEYKIAFDGTSHRLMQN